MQVVWFKRDLRVEDHEPLCRASQRGAVLPLYVIEPDYWALPDTSDRQWQFVSACLETLSQSLTALECPLHIVCGDVVETLAALHRQHRITGLWSHEETGNWWTYQRDLRVAAWCQQSAVTWHEFAQHGVVRRLRTRRGWAQRWDRQMRSARYSSPASLKSIAGHSPDSAVKGKLDAAVFNNVVTATGGEQRGGRAVALTLLDTFLNQRGERYQQEMSSPALAESSCSRLSAQIAHGCLSLREVFQAVEEKQQFVRALPAPERGMWGKSLHSYASRLHWHCHFIQKLEDQPQHEVRHVHRGFEGLRERDFNRDYYDCWARGETGYPFIDACMRYLIHTGWINFRMRAMLMSFAAYQLWLHWREPGLHLARAFTDYEPGIHWNQVQMQSGTTGINTVRIYNPVKQSHDHDPNGHYIRRWVPALSNVPDAYLHEPWKMEKSQQVACGCVLGEHYPTPVVDHLAAAKAARTRLYDIRKTAGFRNIADQIQERHGSRKSGIKAVRNKRKAASPQMDLEL